MPSLGKSTGADKTVANSRHYARPRIEADRHVGTRCARGVGNAGIIKREPVGLRDEPQRRRSVGRAAAKARAGREPLDQGKTAEREPCDPIGERASGAEHEVVGEGAGAARSRSGHRKQERRADTQGQPIAERREYDQALESWKPSAGGRRCEASG